MDFIAALGIAVFAGLCNSMQGSTNTALSTRVGRAQATFVSFAGGTILLGVMVLLFKPYKESEKLTQTVKVD